MPPSDPSGAAAIELSVVLISRNQRWNIERLIESVRTETGGLRSETILVDSASIDGTPELAANAGLRVAQLDNGQRLCPSAGRYVGFRNTSGDFVLFLDGDAELVTGWLDIALQTIRHRAEVAAVTGNRITLPIDMPALSRPDPPRRVLDVQEVNRCGGSALYRRRDLQESGQFDPTLLSEEEPELALRLRARGRKLLQTAYPIIFDYTEPPDRIRTILNRRRRRLYLGTGQVLRKHWGKETFFTYVRECARSLLASVAVVAWIGVLLVALLSGSRQFIVSVAAIPLSVVLVLALKRKSLYSACLLTVRQLCHTEGTIRGLLTRSTETNAPQIRFRFIGQP